MYLKNVEMQILFKKKFKNSLPEAGKDEKYVFLRAPSTSNDK